MMAYPNETTLPSFCVGVSKSKTSKLIKAKFESPFWNDKEQCHCLSIKIINPVQSRRPSMQSASPLFKSTRSNAR